MKLTRVEHDPWAGIDGQPNYRAVDHDPFGENTEASQLILARHGATSHNRGGVGKDLIRGWADIPLSEEGVQDALKLSQRLMKEPIDYIFCSDLSRARDTAETINRFHNAPLHPTKELRSWNMGPEFEGKETNPQIIDQIKKLVHDSKIVPPGGESFLTFVERLTQFIDPIAELMQTTGENVAFVSHGRTVQVLSLWMAAGCDAACMSKRYVTSLASEPDAVSPGGFIGFNYDKKHWVLNARFSAGKSGLEVPDKRTNNGQ